MKLEINQQTNKVVVTESGIEVIEVQGSGISVVEVAQQGPAGPRGEGIPAGGATGQILRKASGTDYDSEWATASGTGDMATSTYDTNVDGIVNRADVADSVEWANVQTKPATFTPSAHNHPISEVTNLQTSLDAKAATSHTHTEADITNLDKYTQLQVDTALAGKANTTHSHAISDVSNLQITLDGKASLSHTHTKADITDFAHTHTESEITDLDKYTQAQINTFLAGKADSSHSHTVSDINSGAATAGYVATADGAGGTSWQAAPGGGAGSGDMTKAVYDTDDDGVVDAAESVPWLGVTSKPSTFPPEAHTHIKSEITDFAHTHTLADITDSGTSASYDVPATGDASTLQVVKGDDTRLSDARTPIAHTHTEAEITDLGNYSVVGHTHAIADVTNLQSSLDGKAAVSHTHTKSEITDFAHTHLIADVTNLQTSLDSKVDENAAITPGTATKITYDAKGLVTVGGSLAATDIPDLDAAKVTTGTFADARISSTSVTQHVTKAYVDGLNVDADTLDGLDSTSFASNSHNHTVDSLSNIVITDNAAGEVLKWNGTSWVNNTLTEANISTIGHTHATTAIVSGTLPAARGGTGHGVYTVGNYLRASGTQTLQQRTPTDVRADIQAAPAIHTHTKSDITDFAHTHAISEVTNLQTTLDAKVDDGAVATILGSGAATADYALLSDGVGGTYFGAVSGGGGGITWTEVTTAITASVDQGYITNAASELIVTLPSTASVGKVIRIAGKGAGGWRLAQQTGQTTYFGTSQTTAGTGGYLASTNQRNAIELVCVTANTEWQVVSSIGNITVV